MLHVDGLNKEHNIQVKYSHWVPWTTNSLGGLEGTVCLMRDVKITGFWYVTPCTLTGTLNSEDGTSTSIHADYHSIRHHVCLMSINKQSL